MTLLVARQCRFLRAPHGAVGMLRQLQRPAVTVAARSYMYEPLKKSDAIHKRLDLTEYRKHEKALKRQEQEGSYLLTPRYEESDIVPVASAILIPASVAAAVSLYAASIWPVLTSIETGTLYRKARTHRQKAPRDAEPRCLPRYPFVCAMAFQRRSLSEEGPRQAVQKPRGLLSEGARHLRCCRQAAYRSSSRSRGRAQCYPRRTQVPRTKPTSQRDWPGGHLIRSSAH